MEANNIDAKLKQMLDRDPYLIPYRRVLRRRLEKIPDFRHARQGPRRLDVLRQQG